MIQYGICTITKDVVDRTGEPELVYRDASDKLPAKQLQTDCWRKEEGDDRLIHREKIGELSEVAFCGCTLFDKIESENRMEEQSNSTCPLMALRGLTILPGMISHFDVSRTEIMAGG